jgi:iron complex outermembrane receptor protein
MTNRLLFLVAVFMLATAAVFAQTVSGRVTAKQDNSPLPGVSVLLKGTTTGTTTDADGRYTITVGNAANPVITFSFIGFAAQEIVVGGQTSIDVVLEEDLQQLNEVVVTALGVSKEKKSLGYATATVASADIVRTASPNFATALYGKAPGVRIAATPGGATSAVNINIRGVNSITGKSQPLIVLNGVPIRDGEVSNNNYWNDQRLRGNGLLDLNPEDIENISILKGASAAALYGSDAVNGVVLVTTKSGKGTKGISVDFSTTYSVDKIAYTPRYQNVRGPGAPLNIAPGGQDAEGFIYYDTNGDGTNDTRGVLGYSINFGPKFDGKPTMTWDGQIRPYEAQEDGWNNLFQPAHNKMYSIAVAKGSETGSTRLSFTRQENEGLSWGSRNEKNIINLNNTFNLGSKVNVDLVVNYINQFTKNRPYSTDRLMNNFTGMIGRFDNGDWYHAKYKTSRGYRFVTGANPSLTPEENIIRNGMRGDLMDYVWRIHEHNSYERSNRIISSATTTWEILSGLKLRGRIAADLTAMKTENKQSTEVPLSFSYTGMFSLESSNDNHLYGDLLLSYTKNLTADIELTAMVGYTGNQQTSNWIYRATSGGLNAENVFDISASVNAPSSDSRRSRFVRDAYIGTLSGNYKDFLFLEGTFRRDRTSTMNPRENSFIYPSVNSGFVFSEAFQLPAVVSYGKLRASWGIVGNYPDPYAANIYYTPGTLGPQTPGGDPVLYSTMQNAFGNDFIRPEQKYEFEFGLETKFLSNRLGLDITYYNGQIRDQILPLSIAPTTGAKTVLSNVGTLRNKGIEIALTGSPIKTKDLKWDVIFNWSKNTNVVEALANGSTELLHADWDGNAAQLKSIVGQPMGDIYVHPVERHANGEMIVDPNGLYKVDANKMVKAGNAMPKAVGGFLNAITYKGFRLDVVIDYRYGGHIMPTALNWMTSRGLTEESLNNMDEEHGGFAYYEDGSGTRIPTTATSGPGGEPVYHDGMLLPGVKADGTPNDYVASATEYYWVVYNWGGPQYSPNTRYELFVKENSYIKMRELALTYQLPASIAGKIKAKRIELGVFGRNLFFFYRTIKDMDPEQATAGSRWVQNVNNVGTNPSSRTYGGSLRISF